MFIGRKYELTIIKQAIVSKRAELGIVYGRRRIGKSTLLNEAAPKKNTLYFEALQGVSLKKQVEHFVYQFSKQTGTPIILARNWHEAFDALTLYIKKKRHYVVFDEFPWMASQRRELVALFKYYWDNHWKQNTNLTMVICGSVASFILNHIIHSKALHNRKTFEIKLQSLSAGESKLFFKNFRSENEICKFLIVFGGIPKYLEQIDPHTSFENNIDRLCFQKSGFFTNEFETIFKEQFKVLKFHRNCPLFDHATMRRRASTKDFRGSFCFLLQTALKSSLNATLAMICLKSEKAKLLRPLTLCRRSGIFSSRVA